MIPAGSGYEFKMAEPRRNPLQRTHSSSNPVVPVTPAVVPVLPQERSWTAESDLYEYIASRGFHFPREVVSRYLLALLTRPFVMFSGISGTGKTKLALLVAEYFAHAPGTQAYRWERPDDTDKEFYIPIDSVTLRSGTLSPSSNQFDYFHVELGTTGTITANITNTLGAHGDMSLRVQNMIIGGERQLTVAIPVAVRRAFEETGVESGDYLKFTIQEEFKRFKVSLFRPDRQPVSELPENRYAFVSVRPSWDDHQALLGYWDQIHERYVRTPMLELLLRADREVKQAAIDGRHPAPYFVILDEMNIAKIEHYFSDFLSALESRRYDSDGSIRQEPLFLHDADSKSVTWLDEQGVEYQIPRTIDIPTNIMFTGTVNDDYSTYDISPKVLDRANVMYFSAVDFERFLGLVPTGEQASPFEIPADKTTRLSLGTLDLGSQKDSQEQRDDLLPLLEINEILRPVGMHFGYRVLGDIANYLRAAKDWCGDSPLLVNAVIDVQILQKVLPKLFKMEDDRSGVLATLLHYVTWGCLPEAVPNARELLMTISVDGQDNATVVGDDAVEVEARFPRSAGKLYWMLSSLDQG